MEKFNIAKFIAHCGICSRRDAEELVIDRKVTVNNKLISELSVHVSEADLVAVNGININLLDEIRIFLFNKPRGYIVSANDENQRKTIFSLLPKSLPRLISVGRLDYNSEGLIILTNYGPFARYFELPQNEIKRVYHVKLFGQWDPKLTEMLALGMRIEGINYQPIKVKVLSQKGNQTWVECTLAEGKNRELRKIFTNLRYSVSRLVRISYGDFHLGDIAKTGLFEYKKKMVDAILRKIKLK